ncbi:MAG: hypothetical protein Q7T61_00965 [Caulobacter sp.]|nr:hypothetical protein [Caulobacter sp.]
MGTIPKLEDCNPGINPVEYNVVVAPEEMESVSKGGIIFTDLAKDTEGMAAMRGILLAISPLAFNYDTWPDGGKPEVGDHVMFAKFGGVLIKGADGKEVRVLKDKDIMAVLHQPEQLRAAA